MLLGEDVEENKTSPGERADDENRRHLKRRKAALPKVATIADPETTSVDEKEEELLRPRPPPVQKSEAEKSV